MKQVSYGPKVCQNLETALKKEWEEKNEKGVYASSSIAGVNTKPAHGLLVVPRKGLDEADVLLAGLDETLFIGERSYPFSTHLYSKSAFPKGYEFMEHFYNLPFPTWIFRMEGLALVKMVMVIQGEETVLIRYQLLSSYGDFVRLQIRPLVAFRSASGIVMENSSQEPKINVTQSSVELIPKGSVRRLHLFHNAAVVDRARQWFKKLVFPKLSPSDPEREENLFSPCSFLYAFLREEGVFLSASTNPTRRFDPFLVGVRGKGRGRSQEGQA